MRQVNGECTGIVLLDREYVVWGKRVTARLDKKQGMFL
jgi:hypothetical protein